MRFASVIALCGLASLASAQIPIPPATQAGWLPGPAGFWFQAPSDGNLVGILVPDTAGNPVQAIDVLDLGVAAPALFVSANSATVLYSNRSTPAGTPEPIVIPVQAGRHYALMGASLDTPTSNLLTVTQNAATTTWASTILGQPVTLSGFWRLGNNYFNAAAMVGSSFGFGRVEASFVPTGPAGPSINTTLGSGCGGRLSSFYERFGVGNAFDLANTSMTMTLASGSGYILTTGGLPFVPPTSAATTVTFSSNNSTRLVSLQVPSTPPLPPTTASFPTLGGPQSYLFVSDDGCVSLGLNMPNTMPGSSGVGGILNSTATIWAASHDYDPTIPGSGQVKFEILAGVAYLTWDGVFSANGGPADTFQFQFDLTTGAVTFAWGAVGGSGREYTVGYSPGGPSADPGSSDLSALGAVLLAVADVLPLTVAPVSRPVIGSTWSLSAQNIPAAGTVGIDVFGLSDPGINDLGAVGAPGCGLRAALDVSVVWPVAGGTHGYALSIPNTLSLLGVDLYTTSAVLEPPMNNALGLTTANGVRGTLGTF